VNAISKVYSGGNDLNLVAFTEGRIVKNSLDSIIQIVEVAIWTASPFGLLIEFE